MEAVRRKQRSPRPRRRRRDPARRARRLRPRPAGRAAALPLRGDEGLPVAAAAARLPDRRGAGLDAAARGGAPLRPRDPAGAPGCRRGRLALLRLGLRRTRAFARGGPGALRAPQAVEEARLEDAFRGNLPGKDRKEGLMRRRREIGNLAAVFALAAVIALAGAAAAEEACKTLTLKNPEPTLSEVYAMAAERAKAWKKDAVPARLGNTSLGPL